MFKTFVKTLAAIMLAVTGSFAFAGSAAGTMQRDPNLGGFDFFYPTALATSHSHIVNAGSAYIQAEFTYYGTYGAAITTPQHVIAAFTQQQNPGAPMNYAGQPLFTHGAGAFVGEDGLALELWYQTPNGQANAITWRQSQRNGCANDVLNTLPDGLVCLPNDNTQAEYLTRNPGFVFKKGIKYNLRVKVTPGGPGSSYLYAELRENNGLILQSARVLFTTAGFLPVTGQDVQATVARTPGTANEPFITWQINNNSF